MVWSIARWLPVISRSRSQTLAVGRHEQLRRLDLFAGREVERAQAAVPGHGVGDVLPGRPFRAPASPSARRGTARRRGRPAAPGRCRRSAASTRSARRRRRCHRRCPTRPRGWRSLRAGRGGDIPGDERRKQVVHPTRLVVGLDLPEQRHALDGVLGEDRLVALPRHALRVAAVGEPVCPARLGARRQRPDGGRTQRRRGGHESSSRVQEALEAKDAAQAAGGAACAAGERGVRLPAGLTVERRRFVPSSTGCGRTRPAARSGAAAAAPPTGS
jgi:hypothetical protein